MGKGNFIKFFKDRWGIKSTLQVILVLVVFACAGFSILFVKNFIFNILGIPGNLPWYIDVIIFLVLTLPIYNGLLLIYGFIFGQFSFFWNFEKRFFSRMGNLLIKPFRGRKA